MTISSVSGRTSYISSQLTSLKNQLDQLSNQLSSGRVGTTYASLGANSGTATGLRAQVSSYAAYSDTITMLNTRIQVANLSLQGISDAGSDVKSAAAGGDLTITGNGKSTGQNTAMADFTQVVALLNAESAGRYLFSGRDINTPATVSSDVMLNGDGATKAGLTQVIAERAVADGTDATTGMGRLVVAQPTATSVSITEDAQNSPFGFKLSSLSTTDTNATISQPSASTPPTGNTMSIDLGTTNPKEGDKFTFTFTLPDQTTETITLTATNTNPPPSGSFVIGADTTATAANLNSAVSSSVHTLANTSLVAASAMAAGNDFFGSPPQRVDTSSNPPVALRDGTADTVSWYTGEAATGPDDSARGTAVASIDPSITVQYGARANETAFVTQLKNIAVYAATTFDANNSNTSAQLTALNSRVVDNLSVKSGVQSIEDIQAEFAGAQGIIKNTSDRQAQVGTMAQSMLDNIQGIDDNQVATELLALQTSLQASYQTTSTLYQLSLVKYLPVP